MNQIPEAEVVHKEKFPFKYTKIHIQKMDDLHESIQIFMEVYPIKISMERNYCPFISIGLFIFSVGVSFRLSW